MNKKIIVLLTILMCLGYTNVSAVDIEACTTGEMTRLKELANNVKFQTNYKVTYANKESERVIATYNIKIVNFDKDLKIYYNTDRAHYDDDIALTSKTTEINDWEANDTFTFKIYSYTTNLCTDEILKTVRVKLPTLNPYYYFNKEKCDDHPNFKYCKEFMYIDTSFDTIDKEFEEYLNPASNIVKDLKNKKIYIYIGIGVGVLVIGVVVFMILKKKKVKDDL